MLPGEIVLGSLSILILLPEEEVSWGNCTCLQHIVLLKTHIYFHMIISKEYSSVMRWESDCPLSQHVWIWFPPLALIDSVIVTKSCSLSGPVSLSITWRYKTRVSGFWSAIQATGVRSGGGKRLRKWNFSNLLFSQSGSLLLICLNIRVSVRFDWKKKSRGFKKCLKTTKLISKDFSV